MDSVRPRDHGEEVAVFRYGLLGQLVTCSLEHGELAAELRRLSQQRVRPPGSDSTRTYHYCVTFSQKFAKLLRFPPGLPEGESFVISGSYGKM